MKRALLGVLCVLALGGAAPAKDKKAGPKKEETPTAADFLGDFGTDDASKKKKGTKQDDLGDALSGVKEQAAPKEDMAPRAAVMEPNAPVVLKTLFVMPSIMVTGGGCVRPKPGQAVTSVQAPDYPFTLQRFSVCATLESARGRSVQVTFKIVTPKGRVVGSSEQRVDFTGRTAVDHVVDFDEMKFPMEGKYFYRMEVEGVMVGQMELFEIVSVKRALPAPVVNDVTEH